MNIPLTIDDLQAKLINRDLNVSELVNAYLERINKHDKHINSFLTVTDEFAKEKAISADKELINKGKKILDEKPLFGTVVALKDIYLTKGIRTTAGSKVLENYIPQYSSTVVERLEKAGAIMIGKTNQDAWAHGASGENSDYGATKNPWNVDYVPGGSSSGSAAAEAANFATFTMGTDTGGSIRQPAGFTSVVGFKPTYGVVPRYGVIAMASSLDCMGHFTRVVKDSKKIFEVIRDVDNKDSTIAENNFLEQKKSYRLGVPKEYFIKGISPEVKKKVEEVIEIYIKAGIEVEEVSLPHTKYAISVYYIIQPAEVSSNLGRYDGVRYGNNRKTFGPEAKRRIMLGAYVLSSGYYDAYYLKAMKVRTKIIQEMEEVFQKVDALIAPISPTLPFKIGEKSNDPLQMYLADILTVPASMAGTPAISIPAGFSNGNLPIGFQLMGPRFSENILFDLGELYQKTTNWKPQVAIK